MATPITWACTRNSTATSFPQRMTRRASSPSIIIRIASSDPIPATLAMLDRLASAAARLAACSQWRLCSRCHRSARVQSTASLPGPNRPAFSLTFLNRESVMGLSSHPTEEEDEEELDHRDPARWRREALSLGRPKCFDWRQRGCGKCRAAGRNGIAATSVAVEIDLRTFTRGSSFLATLGLGWNPVGILDGRQSGHSYL